MAESGWSTNFELPHIVAYGAEWCLIAYETCSFELQASLCTTNQLYIFHYGIKHVLSMLMLLLLRPWLLVREFSLTKMFEKYNKSSAKASYYSADGLAFLLLLPHDMSACGTNQCHQLMALCQRPNNSLDPLPLYVHKHFGQKFQYFACSIPNAIEENFFFFLVDQ